MDRYSDVGKVIEKIKLTNFVDGSKSVEIEALVDTGATMMVVPENVVSKLGLVKIRSSEVSYADGRTSTKGIYGAAVIEIQGRNGLVELMAEQKGAQPLIGQVVLELLDLVVDCKSRRLIPNPRSPDIPMVEILSAS